jgi:PKD domain-containing protein
VRTRLACLTVLSALLMAVGSQPAAAKTTKGFTFKSNGSAAAPGAVAGTGAPGTYQDFPFTIAKDDRDGSMSVSINWSDPFDDWDLYVYRKVGKTLETVGSSTQGAPDTQENAVTNSEGVPITPGQYVIRVQNYAASDPTAFRGFAKFDRFVPPDKIPVAKLSAPRTARAGHTVTLDASKSYDPDGKIKNFAFDLDGNGSMEVNNGKSPILRRKLGRGVHHVAVRVTDNHGLRAYATRTITVQG